MSQEVLIRGPEELAEDKDLVEQTVENIGRTVGEEVTARQVKASDFEQRDDFNDVYHDIEDSRDFESPFERNEGGLAGRNMTSVLILQPYAEQFRNTPVMHVTDRPLFVEDRKTGEASHVYGATQPSYHRPSAVLSNFAFQEMNSEKHDLMMETLAYHEGGHLLSEDGDREYRDEDRFGGGHCPSDDVMNGEDIWSDTYNRLENQLYCQACTDELREGLQN